MKKWIWLDMDGTFADLYKVENWLADLRAYSTRPYKEAGDIYNIIDLLEVLVELKTKGYNIGVISWGAKNSTAPYLKAVEMAKKDWLKDRLFDIILDKILVTPYGICKADTCRAYGSGILVDDEKTNRETWDLGETIDAANENIIKELWKLV